LVVRRFFRHFFPISDTEELREESFILAYCVKGFTLDSILEMTTTDRYWYMKRLKEQLEDEAAAMQKK
jgi:hypothetical protein